MRHFLKAVIALGIALLVVIAMRAFAFAIYTVPTDLSQTLKRGDRVMVNKLSHTELEKGQLVVFRKSADLIGRIEAVPGDTIDLGGRQYLIPQTCCERCACKDCKLYLVDLGNGKMLVYRHEVVGRAVRLFHLPF